MIVVRVLGAVAVPGPHPIAEPATVAAALAAAGGPAREPRRWAAGPVAVRRRRGDGTVDAWAFSLDDPEAWADFRLRPDDLIVVQWHLVEG
jgi:protein involved in polysaccharide export with SLBB domain